ncbi:MAG: glutathione S-transferase family protein [Proteobacteria bacterium]|nr:MAG: glutathione S-transferase family protein [Pseudomonadota bacterium]
MTDARPLRVHGSAISYFTGKLEGYLRYKEIPYERVAMTPLVRARVGGRTGTTQMPAVLLPDGRWMTDTTPILEWLETQHPEPAVIPRDPLQAFASRLVEDYADEWLWRPALHYRWSHRGDALLLSRRIVDEMMPRVPLPGAWKRFYVRRRQQRRYVRGDGVTAATRASVEDVYLRTLDQLEAILASRPFLLGARPTLADFGFFASMFRHFALDPTPAALMLARAPGVFEWVARTWNARGSRTLGALAAGVPDDWSPLLREIGGAYLPHLCANAEAWKARQRRFDVRIGDALYRALPVSRYRVWCLERLRAHFDALADEPRAAAQRLLEAHGCWEPLWRVERPDSGYDAAGAAPFARGLPVFSA